MLSIHQPHYKSFSHLSSPIYVVFVLLHQNLQVQSANSHRENKEMALAMTAVALFIIPLLLAFFHLNKRRRQGKQNLPPSPPSLPIIGNLHQLGPLPHRSLFRLSKKYGPLMHLRLGQVSALVVSSAEVAEQFLKTHDNLFCTRPSLTAFRKFSYSGAGIAFAPYNESWRQLRKIAMLELFSSKRVKSFRQVREEEVNNLINTISQLSSSSGAGAGRAVNLSEMSVCLFNCLTCRLVFGNRKSSEDGTCGKSRFHGLLSEAIELLGGFCAGDFFPSMEWLNVLTGFQKRLDLAFNQLDEFLEREIEEHGSSADMELEKHPDFITVLLKLQKDSTLGFSLTRNHLKAILGEMFIAGSDTSASTLVFGMAEIMRNPRVMKKAQEEVRTNVGLKEVVEESDLQNLAYLKLVVKEILRLRPPAPLPIPHECMQQCKINGYEIQPKTRVLINVWAIARDPKYWEEPELFWPERFETSSVHYKGQDFQFIPFSSGRRICPAISMAIPTLELALANLLHCFNWSLPDGMKPEDLDMEESFGLDLHKKSPLLLVPTPVIPITN